MVEVNGATLYYDEMGAGIPLLFIHGMCGSADVWRDQTQRLSSQFRCIAYDRRGHTRSSLGAITQRTVELHADDAATLIETLGLAPCVLVGSSGGARVAFDVVRRFPYLLRGAVLSEPPIMALDPEGAKDFQRRLKPAVEAALTRGGPVAAVDTFFEIMCPGLWSALPEAARDPYRANSRELLGDLQMPEYRVTSTDLTQLQTPCLAIRGSESLPLFQHIVGVLAEQMPNCQLIEFAGSGHVTYFEKPEAFAAAVTSFVDGI
jgi:pimeloyl-ACP methyl ester carboxylesterase